MSIRYIQQESFGPLVLESLPLRQSSVRSRRRAWLAAPPALATAIKIESVAPSSLSVEDLDTAGGAHLIRLGLKITAATFTTLDWMRLIVRIAPTSDGAGDAQRPHLLSVYPARVDRPVAVHGRIGLDERGRIVREEKMVPEGTSDTQVSYRPYVVGLQSAPDEAVWVWLPSQGARPVGADELFMWMSVSGAASSEGGVRLTRSLDMAVREEGSELVFLSETADTVVHVAAK